MSSVQIPEKVQKFILEVRLVKATEKSVDKTAAKLGISKTTLYARLKPYGLKFSDLEPIENALQSKGDGSVTSEQIELTSKTHILRGSQPLIQGTTGMHVGSTPTSHTHAKSNIQAHTPPNLAQLGGGLGNQQPPTPQELMLSLAIKGEFNAIKYMLENKHLFKVEKKVPKLRYPDGSWYNPAKGFNVCLSDEQLDIMRDVQDPEVKILFVEGGRREGKSTGIMGGIFGLTVDNYLNGGIPMNIDLMAGTGDQIRRIMFDLAKDEVLHDMLGFDFNGMVTTRTASKWVLFDDSVISGHELTVGIKGATSNLVWIDEFDVALKKDPETIMSLIITMRAQKNMKVIMSANMDSGAFQMVRLWAKERAHNRDISFYSLNGCEWNKRAGHDELLHGLGKALVGEDYMNMQLKNEYSGTGDFFSVDSIRFAYENYVPLTTELFGGYEEWWHGLDYIVMAVDPSSQGNPFGWMVLGVYMEQLYEVDSGQMKMGNGKLGTWTPDKIVQFFCQQMNKYSCKAFVIENNTSGGMIKAQMESAGYHNVSFQNWGAEGNSNSFSNFGAVARDVMDKQKLFLKNTDLKMQLTIYDVETKGRSPKSDEHGDQVDAMIHAIWCAVDGMNYMRTGKIRKGRAKVRSV